MIRFAIVLCFLAGPALAAEPTPPVKTFNADDVRAAFRLGVMQGGKQERDREAEAAMAEAAKGAQNILPVLQAPPSKP